MPKIIAITGGIGSGKSVISRILRAWGYHVYDCDKEAKALMDSDNVIKQRIADEIYVDAITNGCINRQLLSEIVFSDALKLQKLNSIVHGAIKLDIQKWAKELSGSPVVFVETAILYTSGLHETIDGEIRVEAPENVRIERVIKRSGLNRNHIIARMESQKPDTNPSNPINIIYRIVNDNKHAVLPQLKKILFSIT